MRYEYVDTFVGATVAVLESAFPGGFGRGDVCLVEGPGAGGEISVSIPIAGELEGAVTLELGRETAVRLFSLACGRTCETLPPLGMDYLRELGNMIAGAAASALNDQGYDVTVAPPLREGSPPPAEAHEGREVCRIPIFSECGSLAVNLSLSAG